ncbi:hypothetical protein LSPH24S_00087 [Lysinibacillus sphaericus]
MNVNELFWQAFIQDIKQGYTDEDTHYTCLLCGEKIEKGIISTCENVLYEAKKFMQHHISAAHQSVFHYLNGLNKKMTGLTDHQSHILRLFYEGKTDQAIKEELAIGSATTIRHHRFALKEKERQAKTFLAMMELLKEQGQKEEPFVPIHKTATMVGYWIAITSPWPKNNSYWLNTSLMALGRSLSAFQNEKNIKLLCSVPLQSFLMSQHTIQKRNLMQLSSRCMRIMYKFVAI